MGSARNLLVTWEISGQVLSLAHNGHPTTRWSCSIVHMTWPLRVSVFAVLFNRAYDLAFESKCLCCVARSCI